jgi:hypothetical protein
MFSIALTVVAQGSVEVAVDAHGEIDVTAMLQTSGSKRQMHLKDILETSAHVPSVVFKNECDFSILVDGWKEVVNAHTTKTITSRRPSSQRISWRRADANRFHGDLDWENDFIEINFDWEGPGDPWKGYPTYSNYNGFNIPSKYEARSPDGSLACGEAGGAFLCNPKECPTGSGPNGYKCQGNNNCNSPWKSYSEKCSFAINPDGSLTEKFKIAPHNYINYPCAESFWTSFIRNKYNGYERSFAGCLGKTFDFVVTTCAGGTQGPVQPKPSPSPAQPTPSPKSGCTEDGKDPWSTGSEVQCCVGLAKTLKNWDGGGWHYKCIASKTTHAPAPVPRQPWHAPAPVPPSPGNTDAATITIKNNCPFDIKVVDGAGDDWQVTEVRQSHEYANSHGCTSACRTYFVPASWNGKPGKYSMGPLEPLGFFEYTHMPDGTLSPDLSFIGGIGIPMTLQCTGAPRYGCTDSGYGGWNSFQERLINYCPGAVKKFPNSDVSYCDPGQYGGVENMPYGKKWQIQKTFQRAGVTMSKPDPRSIAFCQPWSEASQCVQANRGAPGCLTEDICDGEALYPGYDMRDKKHIDVQDWFYNGFAAFVHTICGVYSGYAFPADDHGAGERDGVRMKFASNMGSGCKTPVIELCPAASSAYTESEGFTYPPKAGNGDSSPPPAPAPNKPARHQQGPTHPTAAPPAPTPAPTPSADAGTKSSCHTAKVGEKCYSNLHWAKKDGCPQHPEWYPGLDCSASLSKFQEYFYTQCSSGADPTKCFGCQKPCSPEPAPAPVAPAPVAPAPGSTIGSAPTLLEIINETPQIAGGPTIFDKNGFQKITIFGATFCVAGSGGCNLGHGKKQSWPVDSSKDSLVGIQWNLGRLASDGKTCDNPCRQLQLNLETCKLTLYPTSKGYCSTVPTPTWTPTWTSSVVGNACVVTLNGGTVDNDSDRCSCSWGAYPCECTKAGGKKCGGRCKSGSDGVCGSGNTVGCSFCPSR